VSQRPLDDREMAAWHGFIRAHAVVVRRLSAELEAEHGLSLPTYEVLAHLSEAPGMRLRMSELAGHATLSPSGLTRLVDRLERDGLVRRERCGEDARVVYATLTAPGKRKLEDAWPTHLRGVRAHVVDRLDCDEQSTLARTMERLQSQPEAT
jgi:DNA-binding MarR family transcriptional regulator